uniref:Secreted peptide n=1 Tax=Rhipicephalus pulchellus TaxID=72859 RepID=L7LYB4_RHIPC
MHSSKALAFLLVVVLNMAITEAWFYYGEPEYGVCPVDGQKCCYEGDRGCTAYPSCPQPCDCMPGRTIEDGQRIGYCA